MNRLPIIATAMALSACMQPNAAADAPSGSAPTTDAAEMGAQCDAGAIQDLIGKNADAVQRDAQTRSGARTIRRYVTGSPVTMDFRPDRLNIETDEAGTIVKLGCG